MPESFPWHSLKAETLRSICKDLGVDSETRRKRETMVAFLAEVGTRGVSSAIQDPQAEPTCPCTNGWLSPRMQFILSTVAAVASDLVRDTGVFASEFGDVGGVYISHHIPPEELPHGKKAAALWVKGFSTIFGVIHEMFESGRIPTEPALLGALEELPRSDHILVDGYTKHTAIEHALSGLVQQARQEWKEDFQDIHCDEGWDKLPACAEHDFDWTAIEDMLVG